MNSSTVLKKHIQGLASGKPISLNWTDLNEEEQEEHELLVALVYEHIEREARETRNHEEFSRKYELFKASYCVRLRWDVYERYVDYLIDLRQYEEALQEWTRLHEEEYDKSKSDFSYRDRDLARLVKFEGLLKKGVINGYYLFRIAPKENQLTQFGKRNQHSVLKALDKYIESSEQPSFFCQFFENYSFDVAISDLKSFKAEHYRKFFEHKNKALKIYNWYFSDEARAVRIDGRASQKFVIGAIKQRASELLREAENIYRKSIGAKKVGEAWISETELYYRIKNAFPSIRVEHHGRPDWLGRQHFDIWIPSLKCAIEYQGIQHDKPIEFFGGKDSYERGLKRDQNKLKKAHENGVRLIEVRPGYDIEEVIKKIKLLTP